MLLVMEGLLIVVWVIGVEGLVGIVYWQGDYVDVGWFYVELFELYCEFGDEVRVVDILFGFVMIIGWLGDLDGSREFVEQVKVVYEVVGIVEGVVRVLGFVVFFVWQVGYLDEVFELWMEVWDIYVVFGDEGEVWQSDVVILVVLY